MLGHIDLIRIAITRRQTDHRPVGLVVDRSADSVLRAICLWPDRRQPHIARVPRRIRQARERRRAHRIRIGNRL